MPPPLTTTLTTPSTPPLRLESTSLTEPTFEVQDADGAQGARSVGDREWRGKAGALRNRVGTNEVQEEIAQSARDNLSCNGRLAATIGSVS